MNGEYIDKSLADIYSENVIENWVAKLSLRLKPSRIEHCRRVAQLAAEIAPIYGLNPYKARAAGILHDVARDLPDNENYKKYFHIAKLRGIPVGATEIANPIILHAPIGAMLLKEEWGVEDEEILSAVRNHTVATPEMTDFDKLIFLADTAEPGRQWAGALVLRDLMKQDLDRAMVYALEEMKPWLAKQNIPLHPLAEAACKYFKAKILCE